MGDLRITITTLQAGQPRPYADSQYRYRVDMEYDPPTTKEPYTVRWTGENLLERAARFAWADCCRGQAIRFDNAIPYMKFMPKSAWESEWPEYRITQLVEIEPGIAEVLIIRPYLD